MTARARIPAAAACLAVAASLAAAETPPAPGGRTLVSYLSGATVYLEAGTAAGLAAGDTLRVSRQGVDVALLRVACTSSRRAACDTLWTRSRLRVGDEARYVPHVAAPPATATAALPRAAAPRPAGPRLHGRIGARWLSVDAPGGALRQPALDLRFDAAGAGDGHVDAALDMRSRRTTRDFGGASKITNDIARVYRAVLTLRTPDAHRAVTVGRQTSPTLASINLFDGVLLRTGTERRTFGVFGGTQPDPLHYAFSRDVVQSGAFVEWHEARGSARHHTLGFGGVASQERGQANRDFLFAQASWNSAGLSATAAQEADLNLGWRRHLGDPALSSTSTFATARVALASPFALTAGFDNRRNVRLWRDRLTPETQFDDAYRQGAWGGAELQAGGHARLSGEVRSTAGADRSRMWSGNAELWRLGRLHASLRGRVSRYDGSLVRSDLATCGVGLDPWPLAHIEASGGLRRTRLAGRTAADEERWFGADADVTLGGRWYGNAGAEVDRGPGGRTLQLTSGLARRF